MLSVTLPDNSTVPSRLTNAFWLAGVSLDVFGAVIAMLTARWFEVLNSEDVEVIDETWNANNTTLPRRGSFNAWVIATALFSSFGIVASGVGMFFLGLLILVWEKQPLIVSIISTIPFVVFIPLIAALFHPQPPEKKDIIRILAEKRGRW
jgi:uncharacterized BrkB/YihY/UPF0761 family membrane protein